jgi:hypothetical protein
MVTIVLADAVERAVTVAAMRCRRPTVPLTLAAPLTLAGKSLKLRLRSGAERLAAPLVLPPNAQLTLAAPVTLPAPAALPAIALKSARSGVAGVALPATAADNARDALSEGADRAELPVAVTVPSRKERYRSGTVTAAAPAEAPEIGRQRLNKGGVTTAAPSTAAARLTAPPVLRGGTMSTAQPTMPRPATVATVRSLVTPPAPLTTEGVRAKERLRSGAAKDATPLTDEAKGRFALSRGAEGVDVPATLAARA